MLARNHLILGPLVCCFGVSLSCTSSNADAENGTIGSLAEAGAENAINADLDNAQADGGPLFTGGGDTVVEVSDPNTDAEEPSTDSEDFGGASADNPLVKCESAFATGADPMIDDFEDLNDETLAVDNRAGGWFAYDDQTGESPVALTWETVEGAPSEGAGALHVTGSGYDVFSGIGVGLRWTESGSENCTYDASYYDGITFWARGDVSVRVTGQNPSVRPVAAGGTCPDDGICYDSHGLSVPLDDEWTEYQVAFSALTQVGWGDDVGDFLPDALFVIEFQFPSGISYDVWIDDLAFYRSSEDEPEVPEEPDPAETDGGATTTDSGVGAMADGGDPPSQPESLDGGAPPPPAEAGAGDSSAGDSSGI
jgi:hypothetical protein